MFKNIEYFFDFGGQPEVEHRIERLDTLLQWAGGPQKFAIAVRRVPAVKHFLRKHIGELKGDLLAAAKLVN